MKVFDITAPLPRGTTVLEASAGTGKTWTIAALATRLVAEDGMAITDLLVLTFTRAATQELRSRVRERLLATSLALADIAAGRREIGPDARTGADLPGFLALDASGNRLSPADLAVRTRRLEEAVTEIDAATITTIHGFCQTVLDGLGVVGDTDTGAELVESAADLLHEVVSDLYLEVFSRETGEPAFDYATAVAIAERVTNNPTALILPGPPGAAGAVAQRRIRFAGAVRAELERRKLDLGILTYDDLLIRLANAVSAGDGARDRLRARWRVVLIDEFQDTDDVQWHILKTVFGDGGHDLVLIGDPKQAIYGFRGGDITTYRAARDGARDQFTLARNYRADPDLHAALGGIFDGARLGEGIIAHPVAAGKTASILEVPAAGRLRLRTLAPADVQLGSSGRATKAVLRERLSADVAADIARLLSEGAAVEGRPVRASDVAVLVHMNFDGVGIQAALAERGIHSVISGGASVFDSPAATDWLRLLTAIDRPSHARSVRAAGFTAFFGFTAAELDSGDLADDIWHRLRTYSRLLTTQGVAAVFEAALGWSEQGLAGRLLPTPGGQRLLTDLRHLTELMHHAHPRASAGVLATWIRDQRDGGGTRENLRRLESDADAVQILTIHAAKGLQFPFVYLPTVSMNKPKDTDLPIVHVRGRRAVDVSGHPTRETMAIVRQEAAEEALRLLYVAMTRGQGQVTAYWVPGTETDASPLHQLLFRNDAGGIDPLNFDDAPRYLHQRWGEFAQVERIGQASPLRVRPTPPAAVTGAREWTRTIDQAWRRTSYTALSSAAEAAALNLPGAGSATESEPALELRTDEDDLTTVVGPDGEPPAATATPATSAGEGEAVPSPMADLPRGAHFGSLVHDVLEFVDTGAADLPAEISARVAAALGRWPADVDPAVLTAAIGAVLSTPLGLATDSGQDLTLTAIPMAQQLHELDFELPLAGGDAPAGAAGADLTLADLAPLLRTHLPAGDPLREYAAVVDSPAYRAQSLRGYLTGSIDLVFETGGRFYVADYKTNWLGPTDAPLTTAAYDRAGLETAMTGSSYPLQALLYAVALHRYLRWRLPGYDPATHIGAVLYLYVRGMVGPEAPLTDGHPSGVFTWVPPAPLILALSDLLDGTTDA